MGTEAPGTFKNCDGLNSKCGRSAGNGRCRILISLVFLALLHCWTVSEMILTWARQLYRRNHLAVPEILKRRAPTVAQSRRWNFLNPSAEVKAVPAHHRLLSCFRSRNSARRRPILASSRLPIDSVLQLAHPSVTRSRSVYGHSRARESRPASAGITALLSVRGRSRPHKTGTAHRRLPNRASSTACQGLISKTLGSFAPPVACPQLLAGLNDFNFFQTPSMGAKPHCTARCV
jgi:hypothetical protein